MSQLEDLVIVEDAGIMTDEVAIYMGRLVTFISDGSIVVDNKATMDSLIAIMKDKDIMAKNNDVGTFGLLYSSHSLNGRPRADEACL